MEQVKIKRLFNFNGVDDHKLINGDITNLLNLAKVKYPQFIRYVDEVAYPNNWLPHKIDMGKDKIQFQKNLTPEEQQAFIDILSFLIFLDSIQTNNLPNIAEYITLPEIVYFLARQTYDEAIHSRSYGHILINVFDNDDEINKAIYRFRENEILAKRIAAITEIYQEAKDEHTDENFIKALIGNYLLEGVYFYNGFQFFHNLASRGFMIGSDTQIRYIQRDENVHCIAFRDIIKIAQEELPDLWKRMEDTVYDMFEKAVALEKAFSKEIIGDKILGMTNQTIEDYTNYIANKRLKDIGLKEIFPKGNNPYKHLEKIAAIEDETSNRNNQFETTSITYKDSSILDGWDEI